jgi:hypothetical protein
MAPLAGLALLAACGAQPAKVVSVVEPPKPAPPVAEVVPPRPTPPFGALPNLSVPAVGADGVRATVNAHLSDAQTLWNLRSAFNVAALNCTDPRYGAVVPAYRLFLKKHRSLLSATNKAIDGEFQARFGRQAIVQRESYETQVYNYFAFPQTMSGFCDAVLTMSSSLGPVAPAELPSFSRQNLPAIEAVFERFFAAYDQYRGALAAWEARYGGRISAAQPAAGANGTGQAAPMR